MLVNCKVGDIITLDIDGNSSHNKWRVLKLNNTQAEVVAMFDLSTSQAFNTTSTTATFSNGITGQKYNGSSLDTYLSSWYTSASGSNKYAVVAKELTQDIWYSGSAGIPSYIWLYNGGSNQYIISNANGTLNVGYRYCYALSVQDVIDYVTNTSIGDGKLYDYNIWKMFWGTTSPPGDSLWLRSADAGYSNRVWTIGAIKGRIEDLECTNTFSVRPALTVDLSKTIYCKPIVERDDYFEVYPQDVDIILTTAKSFLNKAIKINKAQATTELTGNATTDKVLSGSTFYSNSTTKLTGAMINRGSVSCTVDTDSTYSIAQGYHNGSGKVTFSDSALDYLIGSNTVSAIYNYAYTGAVQSTTLSKGKYILEVWGAQGGTGQAGSNPGNSGGKGGYSIGTLTLNADTPIYIYAGQLGKDRVEGEIFGGGGQAEQNSSYNSGAGGGASDIRIGSDSLYARVIVAGGGGGGAGCQDTTETNQYGTPGGGLQTLDSNTNSSASQGYATGATQTAAGTFTSPGSYTGLDGAFGQGGSYQGAGNRSGGGGGGGWYGGAAGSWGIGGSGGSGYIYTSDSASNYPEGCLLNSNYYLTDASTTEGGKSFLSPDGTTETGHAGNGYVRIKRLGGKPKEVLQELISKVNTHTGKSRTNITDCITDLIG